MQFYDVTKLLKESNTICITVGRGWMRSPMPGWFENEEKKTRTQIQEGVLAELTATHPGNRCVMIGTDCSWGCHESPVLFSEIYNGETYNAAYEGKRIHEHPVSLLE